MNLLQQINSNTEQFLKEKRFEKKLKEARVATSPLSRQVELTIPSDREHFQLIVRGLMALHDIVDNHVERREINFLLQDLAKQVPYDWFPQQDEVIED